MVGHACVLAFLIGTSAGQMSSAAQGRLVANPGAVAGLTQLAVIVTLPPTGPDAVPVDGEALRVRIAEKLGQVGIKPVDGEAGDIPRLVVRIESTAMPESDQYACRVQVALIRLMILPNLPDPPIPAEVWQGRPMLEVVPLATAGAAVDAAVQSQVNAFLAGHHAARRALEQAQRVPLGSAVSGPPGSPAVPACPFVSSRSSPIFHRVDCRWAQSIAAGNRIGYKSREEALQAGKRPCKTCQP